MEQKPYACFDIGSKSIKALIGYELGGVPVVLHTIEKPIPGLIQGGIIQDEAALVEALASFGTFADDAAKIRGTISTMSLVLPPLGLKIFEKKEVTRVVSPEKKICRVDITNVMGQAQNEMIGDGCEIVDIIPAKFVLDNGEEYDVPPLDKQSSSLSVIARIHGVGGSAAEYATLPNKANMRIKKKCVAPYCQATLFACDKSLPDSYLLVDMGACLTSVTLIGKGSPFGSAYFVKGGDDLTKDIAKAFGMEEAAAEEAKKKYGYSERVSSYAPNFLVGKTPSGLEAKFSQKNLNDVIALYFEDYCQRLGNAIMTTVGRYGSKLDDLPIILTGGASELPGLQGFMERAFPSRKIIFPSMPYIGARDARWSSLLGLVLASGRYVGSLEDNQHGVATVGRSPKKEKPVKKASEPEETL